MAGLNIDTTELEIIIRQALKACLEAALDEFEDKDFDPEEMIAYLKEALDDIDVELFVNKVNQLLNKRE